MDKVVVGMSGGVDSAVAAYLLKKKEYDVIGVTLRVWQAENGDEGRCCDIDDARGAARSIGIPYYPVNCTSDFSKHVVEPFVGEYLMGRTPNPCVFCNRYIKWEKLLYYAKVFGAKYVATGHYASVEKLENGRYTVKTAVHAEKDQTYMLYRLTQEQLAMTLMPLGGLSKEEVRTIARDVGITVASKPDSQEVCFVTEGNCGDFIALKTGPAEEGNFVDIDGNVLARHKGLMYYTIGQRKGLGLALGYPAYVKEVRKQSNEVVIGKDSDLFRRKIICDELNFTGIEDVGEGERIRCIVKIRYGHKGSPAFIEKAENGAVRAIFDEPVRAPAPGQSAVFYDGRGFVIGGGIIKEVMD